MKRVVPVCVALGIVAGLFLLFGDMGGDRARSARERSRRERERRKRKKEPRAPLIVLTGTVRNPKGPVEHATIYLLDKDKFGGDRGRLPHVSSDAQGRWRLRTRKVKGRYLGVVHERYRHAHHDLDAIDHAAPIAFVLAPARRIVATVLDEDDQPLSNQLLQLVPWPPLDQYELPDPTHRQGEHTALTDARGRGEFWVGSDGPVTIRAELDGYFPEPYATALDAEENVALVRARTGVPFPLQLRLADGSGYSGSVDVSLYAPGSDDARGLRALHSVRTVSARDGVVEGTWPPATFGVQVQLGDDRAPVWLGDQDLAAGTRRDVVIAAPGFTHVALPASVPQRALFFSRRAPGTPRGHPDWQRLDAPDEAGLRVADATQRLLVTTATQVALTAAIEPGTQALKLSWKPGQWVTLADHALPPGTRRVVVLHETLGPLPIIGRTGERIRTGQALLHIHVARPGDKVELGPYPAGKLTVRGAP